MTTPRKGDFVEMDGLLAVVIATEDDPNVPDEHVGLWFGDPTAKRISEGGTGGATPEVFTVPVEDCSRPVGPQFTH